MSRPKKSPRSEFNPGNTKVARGGNKGESFDSERIAWHINTLDIDGPWGWTKIDPGTLWDRIHDRLANLESMTWSQIKTDKKHFHSIEKTNLSKEAQQRLEEIDQDDIDEVFSLRVSGKERIFGIRDRHILKLLWWDPNHEVCPSTMGHT